MTNIHFLLLAGALIAGAYGALGPRGETVGWVIGLGHGGLALLALAGFAVATDRGFAVFTALLAVYAGGMCAAEAIGLMRRPAART
ncbi:MAG: hypothetical protein E2577_14140 [Starkeya sp.]|nr:hypothetical protein [Starkeya sp.]